MSYITTQLQRDNKGNILVNPSEYKPNEKEMARIMEIRNDYSLVHSNFYKPYREFNDMSLIDRQSLDQGSFNAYQEPISIDPDQSWKSRAIRPIVRNRVISVAAHLTGNVMFPNVEAQNNQDDEDKDAAMVMREIFEWVADQSNYAKALLYSVIAALVNPAAILHQEYCKIYRTIKEIQPDGTWIEKEVIDEINSGFKFTVVPVDEFLLADFYQHDIQKQPFLIWRRFIDYSVAKIKYRDKENFKYVKPGIQTLYNDQDATFYEQYDNELRSRLVEEVIYYRHDNDLQLVFCNGILLDNPDQPNPRQDKKYPFTKGGYELFDEGKFVYYSSLVKKLSNDEKIVNTLYRMIIDGSYLQLMPPLAIFGGEHVDSSVWIPGSTTTFDSPDAKAVPLSLGANLIAGYNAIEKVEASMSESSSDVLQAGQPTKGQQTAFEISRLEQNASIMLGLFGKMIGFMVKDIGELLISDILQYLTVAQINELTGKETRLKFQNFVIPNRVSKGKNKTRKIVFDADLPEQMTEEEEFEMSFDLMEKGGGLNGDKEILLVNPKLFRQRKFLVKISPDVVTPPSENLRKALSLELYDRAINNPLADQDKVTRELLFGSYDATKTNVDEFMANKLGIMQVVEAPEQSSGSPLENVINNKQKELQIGV